MSLGALEKKVGFLGAGNMAEALLRGFLAAGFSAERACAYDPSPARQAVFEALGCRAASSVGELAAQAEVVFVAVKPGLVEPVLRSVPSPASPLWISIAAGIPVAALEKALSHLEAPRVIRTMPNTPALAQAGATAYCLGEGASAIDEAIAVSLLSAVGTVVKVTEGMMDAVTGLSGSGPAFVMLFIEALADGGVHAGLPRNVALELAVQTVRGSAELLLKTGLHPGALKDQVTSPGGTTIEGVRALESGGFRSATLEAVTRAATRARELRKGS